MQIILNGEKREFGKLTTVGALLEQLGLRGRPVVIEQNQKALLPREIEAAPLCEGDTLEVIQITAGG